MGKNVLLGRNVLEQFGIKKVTPNCLALKLNQNEAKQEANKCELGLGAGTTPPLEMSDAELGARFSESGERMIFFTEFRFTAPSICESVADIQNMLCSIDPSVLVEQSCASDNLHITMNEFSLSNPADVHRVAASLRVSLPLPSSSASLDLKGIGVLGKRVLHAELVDNVGSARLRELQDSMQSALQDAGVTPYDRRKFVPHMTICKAKGKRFSEPVLCALEKHGLSSRQFGMQPLCEICLCCKRRSSETTPPVVSRLIVA